VSTKAQTVNAVADTNQPAAPPDKLEAVPLWIAPVVLDDGSMIEASAISAMMHAGPEQTTITLHGGGQITVPLPVAEVRKRADAARLVALTQRLTDNKPAPQGESER
jgi:hypothetical protein